MGERVVVVGAGYAGTALVRKLLGDRELDLTWISATDYHLVKHEVHRVIRNPEIADGLCIPTSKIISDQATFRQGRVVAVSPDDRTVELASGEALDYDLLALTAGGRTAFYGIPGLRQHARTLTGIDDAVALHDAVTKTDGDPLRIVVGGGGLTGIQVAGELDALATARDHSIEVTIVEALDDLLPHGPRALRSRIEDALEARDIQTVTGSPIVEATSNAVLVDGDRTIPWDVLVWSGGITGNDIDVDGIEQARNRVAADATLRTSDPRVFAFGDAALVDQPNGVAPPTAQAAWQAAETGAANIRATVHDRPLEPWEFESKGTLISVGEDAFAHGITGLPFETVGSYPAAALKKTVAARWIADVDSWGRALRLWPAL